MIRVNSKTDINNDYNAVFTESWVKILQPLLNSVYMHNLMSFIHELYNIMPKVMKGNGFVYPYKSRLFENFRSCPPEILKCVIIGSEPYKSTKTTGIPFAMSSCTGDDDMEEQLMLIRDCVNRTVYPEEDKNSKELLFDETMYSWTYQGVLLLDAASTSEEGSDMAHAVYWRNFTREVVKIINNESKDLIFILLGKEADYFNQYIDKTKHQVLTANHPLDAIKAGNDKWYCSAFQRANEIITEKMGEQHIVYW